MTHIWLRAEQKPGEQRIALTPELASELLAAGAAVTVETSDTACISASEFEQVGCKLAVPGAWASSPPETIILGLKELADSNEPLVHRHIHFAHVYKYQQGWQSVLKRFASGGGTLYDFEFLVDEQGRRVAAFGYWAGYVGAALGLLAWADRQRSADSLPLAASAEKPLRAYTDRQALLSNVKQTLADLPLPRVHIMGALGRSGSGAMELARDAGAQVTGWDIEETRKGGPFPEILQADVLVNCVFVNQQIPPFVTTDMLTEPGRKLSVISDVSCDPFGDYNPLPVYNQVTTLADPVVRIVEGENPVDLIAIDHLPSLLPRESTEDFVTQMGSCYKEWLGPQPFPESSPWARAEALFRQRTAETD